MLLEAPGSLYKFARAGLRQPQDGSRSPRFTVQVCARGPPAASGRFSGEPQNGCRDLRQPPGQLSVRAVIWLRSRACHLRSLEIDFLSWGAGQKRAILFKSFIDETLICCPRSC